MEEKFKNLSELLGKNVKVEDLFGATSDESKTIKNTVNSDLILYCCLNKFCFVI